MRVLFTIPPAAAHLQPIVPLAWALQSTGHEVCVAGHPDMAGLITSAGLVAVPVGQAEDWEALMRGAADDPALESIAASLRAGSQELDLRDTLRRHQLAAFSLCYPTRPRQPGHRPMADDLIAFARAWRPDVVLWDPLCLPGPLAARACGAAHGRLQHRLDHIGWARHRFDELRRAPDGSAGEDLMAAAMRPELHRLGMDFDEELLLGQWTIDLVPPAMRLPLGVPYIPMRRVPYDGAHVFPQWLHNRPKRPRVCLALGPGTGTFPAADSTAAVAELLDMASGIDADFVATCDATRLEPVGALPANVSALDDVPLSLLLPTCSAIVHHGGGGTFASAVTHRVPQLVPAPGEGGDRPAYATYVHHSGAGLMLRREEVCGETLREQTLRLLHEPTFRQGTDRLHTDMLATPTPTQVVPVLERLTADHRH